jgi:hypothetical protein
MFVCLPKNLEVLPLPKRTKRVEVKMRNIFALFAGDELCSEHRFKSTAGVGLQHCRLHAYMCCGVHCCCHMFGACFMVSHFATTSH